MSKLYWKAMIEDVCHEQCSESEISNLLDIFSYTVKAIAVTLAIKAEFRLKDFATAKQRGVEDFSLTIEKRIVLGQEQWWGHFRHGHKNLKVIATLENPDRKKGS